MLVKPASLWNLQYQMNTSVPLTLHDMILWIFSVYVLDVMLVRVTICLSNGYAIWLGLVTSCTTRYLSSLKTMSVSTNEVRYILDRNPCLQSPGGIPPPAETALFYTQLPECQRFQSYRIHPGLDAKSPRCVWWSESGSSHPPISLRTSLQAPGRDLLLATPTQCIRWMPLQKMSSFYIPHTSTEIW